MSLRDDRGGDRGPLVVVMGVSGSGKTAIGKAVSKALRIGFVDGDALHSDANIVKMKSGAPLTDDDRWPWIAKVGQTLTEASSKGLVVACSALKRAYRDDIRKQVPSVVFLHLVGSRQILSLRLKRRKNHFMPTTLLDSQLATLEPLEADESGFEVGIDAPFATVVAKAVACLN